MNAQEAQAVAQEIRSGLRTALAERRGIEDDYAWLNDHHNAQVGTVNRLTDELERTKHDLDEYRAEHRELLDERDANRKTIARQTDAIECAKAITSELLLAIGRAHCRGECLTMAFIEDELAGLLAELPEDQ